MKIRNQILTIAVLVILTSPSLTYAAWWNPLTWFKKPITPATKIIQVETTTPSTKVAVATTTPKAAKETTSVKPKVNPQPKSADQSAKIEKLKKDIDKLKRQQVNNPSPIVAQPVVPALVPVAVPIPLAEDPYLKVEKCKADRDSFRANLERLVEPMVEKLYYQCVENTQKTLQDAGLLNQGYSSASDMVNAITAPCKDQRPNSTRIRSDFDKEANDRYLACINK